MRRGVGGERGGEGDGGGGGGRDTDEFGPPDDSQKVGQKLRLALWAASPPAPAAVLLQDLMEALQGNGMRQSPLKSCHSSPSH